MNRRRNPNGNSTRNRTRVKRGAATGPLKTVNRTFHRIVTVPLNSDNPNGGVYGSISVNDSLSAYPSSDLAVQTYENYRIARTRIYGFVNAGDAGNFATPLDAIAAQAKMFAAMNSTTVEKYIDYDSESVTFNDFLRRDNLTFRGLKGGQFTLIASYVPRMKDETTNNLIIKPQDFMSTTDPDNNFLGAKFLFKNSFEAWPVVVGSNLKINLYYVTDFIFRGMKAETQTTNLPILMNPTYLDPITELEDDPDGQVEPKK